MLVVLVVVVVVVLVEVVPVLLVELEVLVVLVASHHIEIYFIKNTTISKLTGSCSTSDARCACSTASGCSSRGGCSSSGTRARATSTSCGCSFCR